MPGKERNQTEICVVRASFFPSNKTDSLWEVKGYIFYQQKNIDFDMSY